MPKYQLRTDTINDEQNQQHEVYGIVVSDEDISIPDLFTEKSEAMCFVELCNHLDLSSIHLMEVIEDIL